MRKMALFIAVVFCVAGTMCILRRSVNSPENYVSVFEGRQSIELNINNMAILDNKNGCIAIGNIGIFENSVRYKWRFYDAVKKEETSGAGAAKYREIKLSDKDGVATLFDYGSDQFLETDKMNVLWAPHSTTSILIYYNPEVTSVRILPNTQFDDYHLH